MRRGLGLEWLRRGGGVGRLTCGSPLSCPFLVSDPRARTGNSLGRVRCDVSGIHPLVSPGGVRCRCGTGTGMANASLVQVQDAGIHPTRGGPCVCVELGSCGLRSPVLLLGSRAVRFSDLLHPPSPFRNLRRRTGRGRRCRRLRSQVARISAGAAVSGGRRVSQMALKNSFPPDSVLGPTDSMPKTPGNVAQGAGTAPSVIRPVVVRGAISLAIRPD